jgi:hypothetical protein
MTLTLLPVILPHAVAAALSALVSAVPEEAIMKVMVTPWVGPVSFGALAAIAVPGATATSTAETVSPLISFHRFICLCSFLLLIK